MSDTPNFAPRPIKNAVQRDININGYLFPWRDGAPVLVCLDGTGDFFIPLFSTKEKLEAGVALIDIHMDSIKRIDDGVEFLDSIPLQLSSGERLRIMVDPYQSSGGKTRFTEVTRTVQSN